MSHTYHQPKPEFFDSKQFKGLTTLLLLGALAGAVMSVFGFFHDRSQFAYSWLFGFTYFFTLCAGSLFWILVHHAADAEWSVVVRRVLENVAALLPITALLFIPVLLCAPILFKWWTIPAGVDEVLDKKRGYLNIPFFLIRSGIYFLGLSTVALLLKSFSTKQDSTKNARYTVLSRRVTFPGIVVLGLSVTFGAFDWLMGLDYKWFSTMWGVYIFAGAAGSSMALLVLLVTWLRGQGFLKVVTREHYYIMGKLMLAFTVFWAYIGFSQYMLIWYSNIPEETSYFIRRNIESWNVLSTMLVIGRFFIPFPILLLQATKKSPKHLCMVAAWMVLMQLLDLYIVVLPMLHSTGFKPHLLDLLPLLTIGCVLAFVFLKRLGSHSLLAVGDPRLEQSLKLTN